MPNTSPFPGMDPYLESHWGDIHHRLIQYSCDQIQEFLPSSLRARVEERVYLESDEGWRRNVFPDVRVIERSHEGGTAVLTAESDIAVAEPLVVRLPNESTTEGFIEIRDASSGNRVVTVIEVLSAANKAGADGMREYVKKQREVLNSDTSLVEIDLLRRGRRVTAVPWDWIPHSHRTTYHICAKRGWRQGEFEVYRVPLRERLPVIRIPLRASDPDIALDLQKLLGHAYRTGRYDDIDYHKEPEPALEADDAKWADELLRQQGRR